MSQLHWVRIKLYEWGVRNRAQGIGYPTMATTEKARTGRGGAFSEATLPQDLEDIDRAVRMLEPQHKMIIAECYTHRGTHTDHMIRLRLPERTYFRRKNLAEIRVNTFLQCGSDLIQSASR
jgi:hypothetical protein